MKILEGCMTFLCALSLFACKKWFWQEKIFAFWALQSTALMDYERVPERLRREECLHCRL